MRDDAVPLLRNFWYLAAASQDLKRGALLGKRILGEPVLLARGASGAAFALRDICPHRGIPLRYGRVEGEQVRCGYHGWCFGADGACREIPSLAPGQDFDTARIKAQSYPLRELQGNLWIYLGDPAKEAAPPPQLEGLAQPAVAISQRFPCDADQAAFGLMDPTHAAFVHTSWWWKKAARQLRLKEKDFEPAPLGWRMLRHRLPPENRAYRLLGETVTTEITYSLPGLRVEMIQGEKHSAASLTAITPVDGFETEVHQALYCSLPWVGLLKPLARHLAHVFLGQDRRVVLRQQEGLAYRPSLMLIDDADAQAKWFYRLKREWLSAEAEGRDFVNPVKARTLRWRS